MAHIQKMHQEWIFPKKLDAPLIHFKNIAQDLTIHDDLVYKEVRL